MVISDITYYNRYNLWTIRYISINLRFMCAWIVTYMQGVEQDPENEVEHVITDMQVEQNILEPE